MSQFLNGLEENLAEVEEEMQTLPERLDFTLRRLDEGKLRRLLFRLEKDCNRLFNKQFNAEVSESGMWDSSMVVFPFILFPDDWNGPLYRRITGEDMAKWRHDYDTKLHVIVGNGRVEVIALSDIVAKYKTTVHQTILVAEQQGYTVLGWEQYRKLSHEIGKLIGGDETRGKAIKPLGHIPQIAIGIPVTTTDSPQEVKTLPKDSSTPKTS